MQTSLTLSQAQEIVDTFHAAGLFEPPLPTEPKEIVAAGVEILGAAWRAQSVGNDQEIIKKIVALGEPRPDDGPPWDENDLTNVVTPADNTSVAPTAAPTDVPPTTEPIAAVEDTAAASTDATPLESDQEKESSTTVLPALPRDFSKISDVELRSQHATMHVTFAEITHELGLEEADYESAKANLEQAQKIALSKAEGVNVTAKRNAAHTTQEVLDWGDKVDSHHRKVILYRRYKEIVETNIKGLSREYTMRTGERGAAPS